MQHIQVSDLHIPSLGFGTYQITGADAYRMVIAALDIGYRHIDTAQFYENECEIGKAISESSVAREDIFLTTKVWRDNCGLEHLANSVDDSLRKLRCDYVDLLLLHWPTPEIPMAETVTALNEVYRAGKARLIGVSNYNCSQLEHAIELSDMPLVCNQVEYHVLLDQDKLLSTVRERQMFLTAYCPLARGSVLELPLLRELADRYDRTPAQIALRWLVQQPQVIAIPKTSNAQRAQQNFSIFDFELNTEDMRSISALGTPAGRCIDPGWVSWD